MPDREEPLTLWEELKEDFRFNLSDWSSPGFRALAMYRFGAWRLRQRPAIRKPLYYPWRFLHRYVRNRYGIELFGTASLGRRIRIVHQGTIVIHEHAVIGDDCVIRQGVTIGSADEHGPETAPVLESDVELGAGAMIVGPVRIGSGARIGPNVVVTRDVPPGAVLFAPKPRMIFTRRAGET